MPYSIIKAGKGYKVASTLSGKTHSKKSLSLAKAHAQMRAIYANMSSEEKAKIRK